MKKPLVSIIIPVFNGEKYIYESLTSALNQTWPNKEVIIVDNKSTDKTVQIVKSFRSKIIRFYSIGVRNACIARNFGFKQSKGDFIQFLDADDVIETHKIESQIALLLSLNNSNCISSCKWGTFYEDTKKAVFQGHLLWKDMEPMDFLVEAYSNDLWMHVAAWLTPRSLIKAAGGWDETLSRNQDGEFFTRVLLKSQKVAFAKNSVSYYRKGILTSISTGNTLNSLSSRYNSLLKCAYYVLCQEKSSRVYYACASLFKAFMYLVYPTSKELYLLAKEKAFRFGGSNITPHGNRLFKFFCVCFGWRLSVIVREKLDLFGLPKIKHLLIEILR